MSTLLEKKLLSLYEELHAFDSTQANRLDRWRNLEPESALFLSILVRSKQAKNVLEIGTSNGYSTLWLASALETTNGSLTSLEIEEERTIRAQKYLDEFGLAHRVSCLTIDASVFLTSSHSAYDLIFLDAERSFYASYWPDLERLLTIQPGSLLVVDNVVSHHDDVADFISLIDANSSMIKTILPVGAGLLLVTKS